MKEKVYIVSPSNLGLMKMPYSDAEGPGVRKMPDVFEKFEFAHRLGIKNELHVPAPFYQGILDNESGVLNAPEITAYSLHLANMIEAVINKEQFPIVIGGDCSILLGVGLGLKRLGSFGLVHIDGHPDYSVGNLSSTTGGAAGMDLALVTGKGHTSLTNMQGLKPYFEENQVIQVGNRYADGAMGNFEKSDTIKAGLEKLRNNGIENVIVRSLSAMTANGAIKFWIHLDVDVLNDRVMPAVDSRQPDGLTYYELKLLISRLLNTGKVIGLNLTIYDPYLDPDLIFGKRLVNELVEVISMPIPGVA